MNEEVKEAKVIHIDAALPHRVSEIICIKCGNRAVCVRPMVVKLKDLVCENCGPGFIIETGEQLPDEIHGTNT